MQKKTIIVGDVHGCIAELEDILDKTRYDPSTDRLLFTGDLINRGPDSLKVYQLVKKLGATSIIGNHELQLIMEHKGLTQVKPRSKRLQEDFGIEYPGYLQDILSWPLYLENEDFILVHGGLIPGVPLEKSDPAILTRIRTWDGVGKEIKSLDNPPWFEFCHEDKLVVFGHWAALEGIVRNNVIGLDTGCVYGKKLSALILPERKVVSVPARKVYCPIKKAMVNSKN